MQGGHWIPEVGNITAFDVVHGNGLLEAKTRLKSFFAANFSKIFRLG